MSVADDVLREQLGLHRIFDGQRGGVEGWAYNSMAHLLLEKGQHFTPSARPGPFRPIARLCYQQAYRAATRKNSKWVYCEGYAIGVVGIAFPHAWLTHVDTPGEAYDVAWDTEMKGTPGYIGFPFKTSYVRDVHIQSRRKWFSVLDSWWIDWPLLSGKTKLDDVIWTPTKETQHAE